MPRAGLRSDRRAPRPALRGLRRAHALDRLRNRRLLGLRPYGGQSAQGWPADGAETLLQGLSLRLRLAAAAALQPAVSVARWNRQSPRSQRAGTRLHSTRPARLKASVSG